MYIIFIDSMHNWFKLLITKKSRYNLFIERNSTHVPQNGRQ